MKSLVVCFCLFLAGRVSAADIPAAGPCRACLQRAVTFFRSLSTDGGYVYCVTPDGARRWGESPADAHTIEVQPPGTPAVGQAFLRIHATTGSTAALEAARAAAAALIRGQTALGGWEHTIHFDRAPGQRVSFDDDQTQSAISFLIALDRVVDDPKLTAALDRALAMMQAVQLQDGGWPHMAPPQGNYHDFATFNDEGINDCIRVMREAYAAYGRSEYRACLDRAGRFLMLSQLPPPQPGWAQQYNAYLQPAWARAFEPPAVCPSVTVRNLDTLIDLALFTGREHYLEAIPDALRWLDAVRLPNGKWARFVELYTNRPLYYDRGRIRVDSVAELHIERRTGYGYEVDLAGSLARVRRRFAAARDLGLEGLGEQEARPLTAAARRRRLRDLGPRVRDVLAAQDTRGAWVTHDDRFKKQGTGRRWNGEYEVCDRIHSAVFNRNTALLCDYLDLLAAEGEPRRSPPSPSGTGR